MCFASSPAVLWKFVSVPHLQAKRLQEGKSLKVPHYSFLSPALQGRLSARFGSFCFHTFLAHWRSQPLKQTNSSCLLLSLSAQFSSKGLPFSTVSALSLNYDWMISPFFKGLGVIFPSLRDRPLRRKMKITACFCCTSSSLWACQPKLLHSNQAITRPVLEERQQIIPPLTPALSGELLVHQPICWLSEHTGRFHWIVNVSSCWWCG